MEDSIRIQRFEELPTATDFESFTEPRNVPAVFSGCIKGWKAFSRWNPWNGGLDYLQALAWWRLCYLDLHPSFMVILEAMRGFLYHFLPSLVFVRNVYKIRMVALILVLGYTDMIWRDTVPIMNSDHEDRVQLGTLRDDIQMPPILEAKELSSVNLWMNNAQARSSAHYDPHHNLLCVVSGRKQVVLWPPSASPSLYPMPIYGEASNHSSVALERPDYSIYPRAEGSMEFAQKVVLDAGDALFIPEGWFHQVDSDGLTIAINFWWRSNLMSCMLEHMDAYYLRRILRRLIDKEMDQLLHKSGMGKTRMCAHKRPSTGETDHGDGSDSLMLKGMNLKEKRLQEENILLELEPAAVQVLHELVSLVHNCVSVANQEQQLLSASINDSELGVNDECEKLVMGDLKDDRVAKILWDTKPQTLQNVFLAMVHNFPRTLEALVLHVLSPVGAEVLTQKFDEMDKQTLEEDRNRFYEVFYSVFDDQSSAMNSILKGKESFAQQAFKNVLDKYVGANSGSSKRGVR